MEIAAEPGLISWRSHRVPNRPSAKCLITANISIKRRKKPLKRAKSRKTVDVKEIKMRPNIDTHDYDTKMRNLRRFIEDGDKVKLTIRFPRPGTGAPGIGHGSA